MGIFNLYQIRTWEGVGKREFSAEEGWENRGFPRCSDSGRVKIDKMTLKCYPVNRRNKSMRVLDDKGNIAEPTSRNWGKPPDPDSKSEQKLLRWGWVWLLISIMGAIPYSMVRRELTNRWGHRPWWL